MTNDVLLSVNNLRVAFHTRNGSAIAVNDLSFDVKRGQVLGIVGESGSGKSVSCYSLLGLIPTPPGVIEAGTAHFNGVDLLSRSEAEMRKIRGQKIAMIFQDPMTCLNPYMTIGNQLMEVLTTHKSLSKNAAKERALLALEEVGIRDVETRIDQYPHEFSGGMRQRVMIAMALLAEPDLLIADEPTTALDVTVQAQILRLIKSLQASRNLSVIFITHDLGVAAQMADNLVVMEHGVAVEQGNAKDIFSSPSHPYTQKLLSAILTTAKADASDVDYSEQPLLEVDELHVQFLQKSSGFLGRIKHYFSAVKGVSLRLHKGEILGVVGESGSGKSTVGRAIMRLVNPRSGTITLHGVPLMLGSNIHQRDIQMIFQDPYASLNPRMTIFDTLAEPLLVHGLATPSTIVEAVYQLMDDVGLDRQFVKKYPHEFSGGQRQRIAIARAISLKPKLIVADEPVSALDVTIRAQILELLLTLTRKHQMTMLFISHDMSVVRYLCDRVVVMQQGQIVEEGATEDIFNHPKADYTATLVASIPTL
jgi:ABC-type microcin C transport system duplicated ATPase subunit YejF